MKLILNLVLDNGVLRRQADQGYRWLVSEIQRHYPRVEVRVVNVDDDVDARDLYRVSPQQMPTLVYSTQHRYASYTIPGDEMSLANASRWIESLRDVVNPDVTCRIIETAEMIRTLAQHLSWLQAHGTKLPDDLYQTLMNLRRDLPIHT